MGVGVRGSPGPQPRAAAAPVARRAGGRGGEGRGAERSGAERRGRQSQSSPGCCEPAGPANRAALQTLRTSASRSGEAVGAGEGEKNTPKGRAPFFLVAQYGGGREADEEEND